MASAGPLKVEKGKNFEKELLLFLMVLVTLISMQVNKLEGQWLRARENLLLTNDTLSQYELVCLYKHLLTSWSPTTKAGRFLIKSYRLLLTTVLFTLKECIGLRTDSKASHGLELNWSCHYDYYVDACKNQSSTQQTLFKYFQTSTALKHRNAKLKRNSIRMSNLHVKKLGKNKPVFTPSVRGRQQNSSSNTLWEIYSETERNWSVWRLNMQAPLDGRSWLRYRKQGL